MILDGDTYGSLESSSEAELTSYAIDTHPVEMINLEAIRLVEDEWIDMLGVRPDQKGEGYDEWAPLSIVRPHVAAQTKGPLPLVDKGGVGCKHGWGANAIQNPQSTVTTT